MCGAPLLIDSAVVAARLAAAMHYRRASTCPEPGAHRIAVDDQLGRKMR
jgi:hypothetical protein